MLRALQSCGDILLAERQTMKDARSIPLDPSFSGGSNQKRVREAVDDNEVEMDIDHKEAEMGRSGIKPFHIYVEVSICRKLSCGNETD